MIFLSISAFFLLLLTVFTHSAKPPAPAVIQEPSTQDLTRSLHNDLFKFAKQLDILLHTPGVAMPNADEVEAQIFKIRDEMLRLRQLLGIDSGLFLHGQFQQFQ